MYRFPNRRVKVLNNGTLCILVNVNSSFLTNKNEQRKNATINGRNLKNIDIPHSSVIPSLIIPIVENDIVTTVRAIGGIAKLATVIHKRITNLESNFEVYFDQNILAKAARIIDIIIRIIDTIDAG